METEYEDNKPFGILTLQTRKIYSTDSSYDYTMFYPSTKVVDTQYGRISSAKSIVLFKNIDFRTILGSDLYNKYDKFSLELCQFSSIPFSVTLSTYGNIFQMNENSVMIRRNIAVFARGLNWIHSSHSVKTNNESIYSMVTCLANFKDVNNTGIWEVADYGNVSNDLDFTNRCIFQKPSGMVNLQISLTPEYSGETELRPSSTFINNNQYQLAWDWIMQFRIVPIE